MKKTFIWLLFISLFLPTILSSASSNKLLPRHKEWLNLVKPIVTKTEKEVFLKLKTPEERDKFIKLFWARRDPRPDTLENEFYREYMKRVRYADLHFGHNSPKKGHETERGYFYLLLGPPLERQIYATQSKIWPMELWYYQGKQEYGLPPYFYLIFYQPHGMGEYKLYSPSVEGPEKLLVPTMSVSVLNRQTAYQVLKEISGELAAASISYIPGETTLGLTSLSTGTLISNLYSLAEKQFSDAYARTFLAYKDFIETDYTHDYIESDATVKIFYHQNQPYIHWSLEPSRVNLFQSGEKSYASFQLILRLENPKRQTILEKEEEIPFEISSSTLTRRQRQLLAFQDILPIIPGKFTFYLFLKNKTAKDFTSYQVNLDVPNSENAPLISDLLLYLDREPLPANQQNKTKAFSFAGYQYIINSQAQFLPGKPIGLFTQIINLTNPEEKSLKLEINSLDRDEIISQQTRPLSQVLSSDNQTIILPTISQNNLSPGYYRLRLSLLDKNGLLLAEKTTSFIVLTQSYAVIPWVFSRIRPNYPNPDDLYLLATEYFLNKNFAQAEKCLQGVLKFRQDPSTKLLLAKTFFARKNFDQALSLAKPLYEENHLREAGKILAAIYAQQKKWPQALDYLEQLLSKATEIPLLNLAAQGYAAIGQPEKALQYLNKSLELKPDQPALQRLKEKLNKSLRQEK
jgi:GWxTD domain-containing protein